MSYLQDQDLTRRIRASLTGESIKKDIWISRRALQKLSQRELARHLKDSRDILTPGFIIRRGILKNEILGGFLKQVIKERYGEEDSELYAPIKENKPWDDYIIISAADRMSRYVKEQYLHYLKKQLALPVPGFTARRQFWEKWRDRLKKAVRDCKDIQEEEITESVLKQYASADGRKEWDPAVRRELVSLLPAKAPLSRYFADITPKYWEDCLGDKRHSYRQDGLLRIAFILNLGEAEEQKLFLSANVSISFHNPQYVIMNYCRENNHDYQWEDIEDFLHEFERRRAEIKNDRVAGDGSHKEKRTNFTRCYRRILNSDFPPAPEGMCAPQKSIDEFINQMLQDAAYFTPRKIRHYTRYNKILLKHRDVLAGQLPLISEKTEDLADSLCQISDLPSGQWNNYLSGNVKIQDGLTDEALRKDLVEIQKIFHLSRTEQSNFLNSCKKDMGLQQDSFQSYYPTDSFDQREKFKALMRAGYILVNNKNTKKTMQRKWKECDMCTAAISQSMKRELDIYSEMKPWLDAGTFYNHIRKAVYEDVPACVLTRADILFSCSFFIQSYLKTGPDVKHKLKSDQIVSDVFMNIMDTLDELDQDSERDIWKYVGCLDTMLVNKFEVMAFYPALLYDRVALLYLENTIL